MKKVNKTLFTICLLPFIMLFSCTINNSDNVDDIDDIEEKEEPRVYDLFGEFDDDDYLKVSGDKIINQKDEKIILRGINAGGYLVTEQWMCAAKLSKGSTDHLSLTNKMVERFGKEKTLELREYYRTNFWTDDDFKNIKNMGMNVIRLPFSYMSLDPLYNNVKAIEGEEFNFEILDSFIEGAASYGLYVILDMHGCYGSQNGQDHSGQIFSNASDVDFYSNEEKQQKTIHLWEEIAKHYKDVSSIAGYDLINEPGEKAASTTTRHWEVYDKIYEAVRKIDKDRIIIFESCWDGANLPKPAVYDWSNCVYSFHNYSGQYTSDENLESFKTKLNGVYSQNFGVPYYMGEFNCYNNEQSWNTTLAYLNNFSWHWTSWTYKLNSVSTTRYGGWGIYYSRVEPALIDTDSFEEIKDKRYQIDTNYESVDKMTFDSTITLENIMSRYC